MNGCPLRRVNQIYTIATKTRLDIDEVKVGNHLNDRYFKRQKLKKPKHTEGEIFDTKKEVIQKWLNYIVAGFPLGLENLGKWEGIFQSGKSQGILEQTGKVGKNHTKYWKIRGISDKYYLLFLVIFK